MFCINCGQELPDVAKFCFKCGTALGSISTFRTVSSFDSNANINIERITIDVNTTNIDQLLQNVEIMLKNGDFYSVFKKCDSILDSDPKNGEAYLYMLMSSLHCRNRNELANQDVSFENNDYYKKIIRYGDNNLKEEVKGYINVINARNLAEQQRKAAEQQRKDAEQEEIQKNPKAGDSYYFGTINGGKLWWKILRIQCNRALIISLNNICDKCFDEDKQNRDVELIPAVPWSKCSLRRWLNGYFFINYFNQEEKTRIIPTKMSFEDRYYSISLEGVQTTDRIFLLSISEAEKFFSDNNARSCHSNWWLRSPALNTCYVAYVDKDGKIRTDSKGNGYFSNGVRPAMWIKLDKHS